MGKYVFSNCNNIEQIYYNSDKPVTAESNIFSNDTYNNATLYLPEAGIEPATNTSPWNLFKNIVPHKFPSGVNDILSDTEENIPVEVYNLNGVKIGNSIETLSPGIYIVRQGLKTRQILIR